MRIGVERDQRRRVLQHERADVRMQIEGRKDRHVGAGRSANPRQHRAIAVVVRFGHHRTMQIEHDRVRRFLGQCCFDSADHQLEGAIGDQTARNSAGRHHRNELDAQFRRRFHRATDNGIGSRQRQQLVALERYRSLRIRRYR